MKLLATNLYMYVENVVNLKLSTLEEFKPFGVKWKPASALVSMVLPRTKKHLSGRARNGCLAKISSCGISINSKKG